MWSTSSHLGPPKITRMMKNDGECLVSSSTSSLGNSMWTPSGLRELWVSKWQSRSSKDVMGGVLIEYTLQKRWEQKGMEKLPVDSHRNQEEWKKFFSQKYYCHSKGEGCGASYERKCFLQYFLPLRLRCQTKITTIKWIKVGILSRSYYNSWIQRSFLLNSVPSLIIAS